MIERQYDHGDPQGNRGLMALSKRLIGVVMLVCSSVATAKTTRATDYSIIPAADSYME